VMRSAGFDVAQLRPLFKGPFFLGGGYDRMRAEAAIVSGEADAVVFGKLYVSNPDLVARFKKGAAVADADGATFYTPGARGYTDYPALG
jgi:N-ethylmaleimide reductase